MRAVPTIEGQITSGPQFTQSLRHVDKTLLVGERGRIVQLLPGVLTVNQTTGYPGWASWLPEVLDVLASYRKLTRAGHPLAIGAVYLNRVELPGTEVALGDWLQVSPHLGPDFPTAHGPFSVTIEFGLDEPFPSRARLDLAAVQAQEPDHIGFDLVIRAEPGLAGPIDPQQVEPVLDASHEHIERLFEASITSTLRAHFEEITSS